MPEQTKEAPDTLDTPIMPTGSGVADLEVAREIDALNEGEALTDTPDAITSDEVSSTADAAPARKREELPG